MSEVDLGLFPVRAAKALFRDGLRHVEELCDHLDRQHVEASESVKRVVCKNRRASILGFGTSDINL
jgi:hypothetical protein